LTVEEYTEEVAKDIASTVIELLNRNYCLITGLAKNIIIKTERNVDEVFNETEHLLITEASFKLNLLNKGYYQWREKRKDEFVQTRTDIALMWLKSPYRNEKTHIGFFPEAEQSNWNPSKKQTKSFNLYRGLKYKFNPDWNNNQVVKSWLRHIKENVCQNNKTTYTYTVQWLAHCVQKPWEKKKVSIVLKSMPGSGKGIITDRLREMMNGMFVSPAMDDIKQYNGTLAGKLMVFLDETTCGGKKGSGILKKIISEPVIHANQKYIPTFDIDNYASFIIASNSDWIVPADMGARRFLCLELLDTFNVISVFDES